MKFFTFITFLLINILSYSQKPTEKEINWLKKQIYPLNTVNPNSKDNNDLKVLNEIIGNAKIVALGETTHGSSEIYQMKHRIIKYLAEEKEFNVFSVEERMPDVVEINEYIQGENKNINKVLSELSWVWNTQETLNLIEWMKKYKKIKYTGFDMQYYEGAIKELKKELREQNTIKLLLKIENRLLKFQNRRWKKKKFIKLKKGKREFLNDISKLKENIRKTALSKSKKLWLLQNCRIIEQFINHTYYERDKFMAENILWIIKNNPNSKLILSAHNEHIQNSYGVMGNILKDSLKNDYLSIGFAINTGTYTSVGKNGLSTYKLQNAYNGTYEYYFKSINEPIFILDLRKLKKVEESEWLFKQSLFRTIGAESPKEQFNIRNLTKDYDIIIFINKSSNSKLRNKNHT